MDPRLACVLLGVEPGAPGDAIDHALAGKRREIRREVSLQQRDPDDARRAIEQLEQAARLLKDDPAPSAPTERVAPTGLAAAAPKLGRELPGRGPYRWFAGEGSGLVLRLDLGSLVGGAASHAVSALQAVATKTAIRGLFAPAEVGSDDQSVWARYELPPGRSLATTGELLRADGRAFDPRRAMFILLELCDVLSELHGDRLHGALLPSHVWLADDGRVLLLDVAAATISELIDPVGRGPAENDEAPELRLAGSSQSVRSDLYSLAKLGQWLMPSSDASALGRASLATASQRHSSIAEFADDLRATPLRSPTKAQRASAPKRLLPIAGGVAGLAIIGGAAWFFLAGGSPTPTPDPAGEPQTPESVATDPGETTPRPSDLSERLRASLRAWEEAEQSWRTLGAAFGVLTDPPDPVAIAQRAIEADDPTPDPSLDDLPEQVASLASEFGPIAEASGRAHEAWRLADLTLEEWYAEDPGPARERLRERAEPTLQAALDAIRAADPAEARRHLGELERTFERTRQDTAALADTLRADAIEANRRAVAIRAERDRVARRYESAIAHDPDRQRAETRSLALFTTIIGDHVRVDGEFTARLDAVIDACETRTADRSHRLALDELTNDLVFFADVVSERGGQEFAAQRVLVLDQLAQQERLPALDALGESFPADIIEQTRSARELAGQRSRDAMQIVSRLAPGSEQTYADAAEASTDAADTLESAHLAFAEAWLAWHQQSTTDARSAWEDQWGRLSVQAPTEAGEAETELAAAREAIERDDLRSAHGHTQRGIELLASATAAVARWRAESLQPDADGWLPVHRAAHEGDLDAYRRQLALDADPWAETDKGDTPFTIAARAGATEILDEYLDDLRPRWLIGERKVPALFALVRTPEAFLWAIERGAPIVLSYDNRTILSAIAGAGVKPTSLPQERLIDMASAILEAPGGRHALSDSLRIREINHALSLELRGYATFLSRWQPPPG